METKKVIERIVREFEKNDSAQSIIDNCEHDLLEYYYWEYKELEWEHTGWLTKINSFLEWVTEKSLELLKNIEEKNQYIKFLELTHEDNMKVWTSSMLTMAEQIDITREEMLLNLKEQGYE
jgi:hypothetical protein